MASAQEMGSRRGKGTCQEKGAASFCPVSSLKRPAHHIYLGDAVEALLVYTTLSDNESCFPFYSA